MVGLLDELDVFDQGDQAIVLDDIGLIQRLVIADLVDDGFIFYEAAHSCLLVAISATMISVMSG